MASGAGRRRRRGARRDAGHASERLVARPCGPPSLALVSVAAALAFGRVFADGGFVGLLLVAAVVPHVVGWVGRVRRWPLAAHRACSAAPPPLLALVWISAGETTFYGIPTARPSRASATSSTTAGRCSAPASRRCRRRPGVVLLCALAVGVGRARGRHDRAPARRHDRRARSDAGAVRAHRHARHRRPAGPDDDRVRRRGAGGAHDRQRGARRGAPHVVHRPAPRVGRVGRAQRRRGRRRGAPRRAGHHTARPRRRQRAGAAVPQLVGPGRRASATTRASARSSTSAPGSSERSNIELFRVDSDVALYWRLIALDRFDGTTWSLRERGQGRGRGLRQRTRPTAPCASSSRSARSPTSGCRRRSGPSYTTVGNARAIPESATLIAPTVGVRASSYQVRSVVERPPTAAPDRGHRPAAARRPAAPTSRSPTRSPTRRRRQALAITAAGGDAVGQGGRARSGSSPTGRSPTTSTCAPATGRARSTTSSPPAAASASSSRPRSPRSPRASGLPSRVVVGFTPGTLRREHRRVRRARARRARVGRGVVRRARLAHVRADARGPAPGPGRRARHRRDHPGATGRARPTTHADHRADVGHHRRRRSTGRAARVPRPGQPRDRRGPARRTAAGRRRRSRPSRCSSPLARRRGRVRDPTARPAAPRPPAPARRRRSRRRGSPARGRTRSTRAAARGCRCRAR